MSQPTSARSNRAVRIAFAILALASLGLGLALHLVGASLGFDEATGRLMATAFLMAGALDALVLIFWERLFGAAG